MSIFGQQVSRKVDPDVDLEQLIEQLRAARLSPRPEQHRRRSRRRRAAQRTRACRAICADRPEYAHLAQIAAVSLAGEPGREPLGAAAPGLRVRALPDHCARRGDRLAKRGRKTLEPGGEHVRRVPLVPGEALVTPISVEGHGHVLARQLGQVEAGQRRVVAERLAVVTHELREQLDRVRLHDQLVMIGREAIGDQSCPRQLVDALIGEADREGLHRLGRLLGHGGDDSGRVDPT